jgi:Restriction endonuclease
VSGPKKTAQATKTVNPLHFEDLEPKRFEDLVRQLAYAFKTWKLLEPTGLLGDDEGIDILGVEAGTDDDRAERHWRFQCKRYKRLSPSQIRAIVKEVVPDPHAAPYGLVIAAACNFTSSAILAFHEEAKKQGVQESQLWSKAKLEDQLFQPQHDHLLFGYFGISLRTRKRGELESIRYAIAIKRKLRSALKKESLADLGYQDIIVRNAVGDTYPKASAPGERDTWQAVQARFASIDSLCVLCRRWIGWRKPDETWDYDRETEQRILRGSQRDMTPAENERDSRNHRERVLLEAAIPDEERISVVGLAWLPYAGILEIDDIGDPSTHDAAPHLFCEMQASGHPYEGTLLAGESRMKDFINLDPSKRNESLFKELRERTDLSEAGWKAHWAKVDSSRHK